MRPLVTLAPARPSPAEDTLDTPYDLRTGNIELAAYEFVDEDTHPNARERGGNRIR